MKVVLFCGGAGMRLRGYADDVPKPMVQIGTRPILWHLMKYYAHFGHKDFILCLGYKGNCIKDYFLHYDESVSNDFVWSQGGKKVEFLNRDIDDWTITFVETGANANIGERLKAVEPYLQGEEMFLANYGDGLSDRAAARHDRDVPASSNAVASLLLVQPTASFDIVGVRAGRHGQRISALEPDRYLDQRRLLRAAQGNFRLHSARRRTGAGALPAADRERGLLAYKIQRLLAVHGHLQGQAAPGRTEPGSAPWKVWNHTDGSASDPMSGLRRGMIQLKIEPGRAADSLPGRSFRRYRNRLRRHDSAACRRASRLRIPLGGVQRHRECGRQKRGAAPNCSPATGSTRSPH